MKPQSGKNRTFQCRRHFDALQAKHELIAESWGAKGGIGRTSSRQVLSKTDRVQIKTSNLYRLLIILVGTLFLLSDSCNASIVSFTLASNRHNFLAGI